MASYTLTHTGQEIDSAVEKVINGYKDVSSVTATAEDVLSGKEIVNSNGTLVSGTMTNVGTVNKTISSKSEVYTIPSGKHSGSGTVQISTAEQNKIIAGNIKKGVSILGVTGTCETGTTTSGTDTSDATATTSDIRKGKTAYVNGSKITGNMTEQSAQTITPSTTNKTISSGQYLTGTQTIKGDTNLVAGNIKSGISIFGVMGTYTGSSSGGSTTGSGLPSTITAGDTPVASSWVTSKVTDSSNETDTGVSLTIKKAGTYRFKILASSSGNSYNGSSYPTVYLYKNGSSVESASINTSSTLSLPSFDVACVVGDVIKVYAKASGSSWSSVVALVYGLVACINWDNGM